MKAIKRVFKVFGFVISVLAFIILVDYIRINVRYMMNKKNYEESVPIKGTRDGYAPQGITYSEEYNVVLQTAYKKNDISKLYVIDFEKEIILQELELYLQNGLINTNHVGGIATDGEYVWITGNGQVNIYLLSNIINAKKNKVKSIEDKSLPNRGDFCYYKDNTLWIGDFYLKPLYNVPNDNPQVYAYDVSKEID